MEEVLKEASGSICVLEDILDDENAVSVDLLLREDVIERLEKYTLLKLDEEESFESPVRPEEEDPDEVVS